MQAQIQNAQLAKNQNDNKECVEGRQDPKGPPQVERFQGNRAGVAVFFEQQRGDQKTTDHEKYRDSQIAVSENPEEGVGRIVGSGVKNQH